jgi:2-(1,2-epoxy-1,2-dihydrophenyl)acetyl-CoA isomerase
MKTIAEPALFTRTDRDGVTVLRFSRATVLPGADLGLIGQLWDFFEAQRARPSKVLVLETPAELMKPGSLEAMWEDVDRTKSIATALALAREENALHRFIQEVRAVNAFVVCVLQGEIDLPFLGPALACDYRIAADDTVFTNRGLRHGLPVCGAVTWFLTHHLGPGKALEILLDPGLVTAEKARELSLVNEVVPVADLERRALERAAELAKLPATALVALKRSLVATTRPLHEYLDEECRIFERFV